jgi:hypothetical protein
VGKQFINDESHLSAIAGEAIDAGEVCSITGTGTSRRCYLACAGTGIEELPAVGIAEVSAAIGDKIALKRTGLAGGYESLTPGAAVYLGNTPGAVQVTAGDTAQICGVAETDEVWALDFEIIGAQTQH